jgi:hypothetical protein
MIAAATATAFMAVSAQIGDTAQASELMPNHDSSILAESPALDTGPSGDVEAVSQAAASFVNGDMIAAIALADAASAADALPLSAVDLGIAEGPQSAAPQLSVSEEGTLTLSEEGTAGYGITVAGASTPGVLLDGVLVRQAKLWLGLIMTSAGK